MSQPAGPPPYEAIYVQGVQTQPVHFQPQPQPQAPPVIVVQQQPQYVVQQVITTGGGGLIVNASEPTVVVCPVCNSMIRTNTVMAPALRTHLCACILCACGLWPCCPIPYCMPSCNDVDHFCPNCQSHIGSYRGD